MKIDKQELPVSGTKGIKVSYRFINSKKNFVHTYDFANKEYIIHILKDFIQDMPEDDEINISSKFDMMATIYTLEMDIFNYEQSQNTLYVLSELIEERLRQKCDNEELAHKGSFFIGVIHLLFKGFTNGIEEYKLIINERVNSVRVNLTDEMCSILESYRK